MTCKEFADFIADYRSAELAPDVRGQFEDHLARCANCRRYLRAYEDTVTLGRHAYADGDPLPADVPEELVQAILAARRRP